MGVEAGFDLLHGFDLPGCVLNWEERGFAFAETVLRGDGASERDGVSRELFQELSCNGCLGFGGGKHVDVEMGVADVAEDDVVAGEFGVQALAVEGEHVAAAGDGDGVVSAQVEEAASTHGFGDKLGEGMAEEAEALAVFGADGEPGGFDEGVELFEAGLPGFDIVAVGFDEQRGCGVGGDLGVTDADHVEGVAVGVLDHV